MNSGVVNLAESLSKDLKTGEEKKDLFLYDNEMRTHCGVICGIDEAGRGPLAGDVYAAAVILPDDIIIDGINDSKKLTEKKREALFDIIREKAVSYCIATASVEEIDSMNILNAAMLAMKRAYEGLDVKPDTALIDGNKTPGLDIPETAVVKGDATSASIAAASILAKVARDRYMKELAEKYPQYMFEKHKGYGTKLHYEMLDKYGASDIHRKSFLVKYFKAKGDILVFVEVKTRRYRSLVSGVEAVGYKKKGRIIATADCFLAEYGEEKQIRYDIAEVTVSTGDAVRVIDFRYFKDAFDTTGYETQF